jgi:hypothetical protein
LSWSHPLALAYLLASCLALWRVARGWLEYLQTPGASVPACPSPRRAGAGARPGKDGKHAR